MGINNKWTEAEIELLKSWVGKKHLQQIIEEWNAVAKKNGWCLRGANGLKVKATRLFKSKTIRPDKDNWSMATVARRLEINPDRIQKWIELGLKVSQFSYDEGNRPHITCISRRNLKKFALSTPEQFWGIDPKRLSKILNDSAASKAITTATAQPTVGRAITVVRLDTGDVFKSARSAAVEFSIEEKNTREKSIRILILNCCKRDTPLRNGTDWAQLDYPVYWVPIAIREEFNQLAGKALYELYLQLRSLNGYSKTSCLVVAARIAVQITLWAYRRNIREKLKNKELTPKQIIIEYWQERWINSVKEFLALSPQQGWRRIVGSLKRRVYKTFAYFLGYDRGTIDLHLEEFALFWMEKQTKRYLEKSCLPTDYQAKTVLEQADLFAFIYGAILTKLEIKPDVLVEIPTLKAWQYIDRKNLSKNSISVDLSGIESKEFDNRTIAISNKLAVKNNDYEQYYVDFINYIEKSVSAQEHEILKLYLDLKLEEASDREVASAMNIRENDVLKIEQKIKYLAKQYATV